MQGRCCLVQSESTCSNMMSGRRKLGRRTVVGRIVSESYGAAKQQHTFTVEVLWSKGDKRLDPLTPLFVKGRNLYKMRTYRQRWKDEKERLNVLAEKHERGAAARSIRFVRNAKAVVKEKKSKKGPKRHKHSHHLETRANTSRKKNHPNQHGQLSAKNKNEQPRPISEPFQTTSSWMQNSHTRHHQVPVFQSNRVGDFLCHPYNLPIRNPCHFQSNGFPRDQMRHFFPSHRGVLPCPENAFPNWKGFSRGGYMPSRSSHVPRKPAW